MLARSLRKPKLLCSRHVWQRFRVLGQGLGFRVEGFIGFRVPWGGEHGAMASMLACSLYILLDRYRPVLTEWYIEPRDTTALKLHFAWR